MFLSKCQPVYEISIIILFANLQENATERKDNLLMTEKGGFQPGVGLTFITDEGV